MDPAYADDPAFFWSPWDHMPIPVRRALMLVRLLRSPDSPAWHRQSDGALVLNGEREIMAELGLSSRVQLHRAMLALEELAPGAIERRLARPGIYHPELLDNAVRGAEMYSPLYWTADEERALAEQERAAYQKLSEQDGRGPVELGGESLPQRIVDLVRETVNKAQPESRVTDLGDIRHLEDRVIRLGVRTMSGTVLEFEPAIKRVRWIEGRGEPTPALSPAGEWREFFGAAMPIIGSRMVVTCENSQATILTPVVAVWAVGVVDPESDIPVVQQTIDEFERDADLS